MRCIWSWNITAVPDAVLHASSFCPERSAKAGVPSTALAVLFALAALLVVLASLSYPTLAQDRSPDASPSPEWLEAGLVSADPDFLFWIGRMAMMEADGAKTPKTRKRFLRIAVRAFERLIVIDPSEVRPRMELGRALFLLEKDSRARRHFEKVLAADLPPIVKRNILAHINMIQRRKRWFGTLSVALAGDSNIGAADDEDMFYIGSFLFRLDNPNKPESGIGFHTWANGQYFHPLHRNLNWRLGAELLIREYSYRHFDGIWLGAQTGPQVVWGPLMLSTLAESGHYWRSKANRPESHELGFRVDGSLRLGPQLTLHPHARLVERNYRETGDQNGLRWSTGLTANLHVTPQLIIHGGFRYAAERPQRRDYRNIRRSFSLGGSCDLPFGVTAALDASFVRTGFEPNWSFFTRGEPERKDRLRSYRFSLGYRGRILGGFAPRLSVTRDERKSNAQLQGFERWHGQIALVRQF